MLTDETFVWTSNGAPMNAKVVRNDEYPNGFIDSWMKKQGIFTGEFIVTPCAVYFEFEEEALIFQLTFIEN